jgi:hypothetical protein
LLEAFAAVMWWPATIRAVRLSLTSINLHLHRNRIYFRRTAQRVRD